MSDVFTKISLVQKDLSLVGISKDRKNDQQNYKFRGIDDVYAALSPLLHKHGLLILPNFKDRIVVERQSSKGGALFSVTVTGDFDFIAASDGSKYTVTTFGEAMDSADKATNKAMSAAYKYAAFQALCIPTEGDNDADAVTHEVTNGVAESILANHLAAIESADSLDALKAAFASAYKSCQRDEKAVKALIAAKDARKDAVARVAA